MEGKYLSKTVNFVGDQPVGFTVDGIVGMAGGRTEVSRATGVSVQSIRKWSSIPAKHARAVAILAGLPLAVVRPDMVRGEE